VPILFVLNRLARDRRLMGPHASGPVVTLLSWLATAVVIACVAALAVVSLT
jgi:hypothetical protein